MWHLSALLRVTLGEQKFPRPEEAHYSWKRVCIADRSHSFLHICTSKYFSDGLQTSGIHWLPAQFLSFSVILAQPYNTHSNTVPDLPSLLSTELTLAPLWDLSIWTDNPGKSEVMPSQRLGFTQSQTWLCSVVPPLVFHFCRQIGSAEKFSRCSMNRS